MTTAARIPESLLPLAVGVDDLVAYHRNPRTGDLEAISESLAKNGQYRPIVVNKGTLTGRPNEILAGNHTYAAAVGLGWEQIAATFVDVDDEAAARIVVVDNRTSDLAGYDTQMLGEILAALPDLEGTGYDPAQLDSMLVDSSLPATLELPTDGAGTGTAVTWDFMEWGYLQWSSTRVRISANEVEAFNALYRKFLDDRKTDLGFGWHVLENAHEAEEPADSAADGDTEADEDQEGDEE